MLVAVEEQSGAQRAVMRVQMSLETVVSFSCFSRSLHARKRHKDVKVVLL